MQVLIVCFGAFALVMFAGSLTYNFKLWFIVFLIISIIAFFKTLLSLPPAFWRSRKRQELRLKRKYKKLLKG